MRAPASWWTEPDYEQSPSDDDDDEFDDHMQNRDFVPPTLLTSLAPPAPEPTPRFSLHGRTLQVIFKMAEVRLTPEKPRYAGGAWHIEGMRDEAIVATAIYYAACENVTESRLMFREQVEEPDYEQYDDDGVRLMYGLANDEPLNQSLGYCTTAERRMLAWPNTLQHRVTPFELADHTRPGRRAIVVAFLVDPYVPILSTAVVPPQQREWLAMALRTMPLFHRLPRDVFDVIVRHLSDGDSMTRAQAVERRARLMDERKYFVDGANVQWFERPFSLCEH